MPENQEQLDKAKQEIAERLGTPIEEKKEETPVAKTDVVVDEKKEEPKKEEEKKVEEKVVEEEIPSVIKIAAKQEEKKEEKIETEEDEIDEAKLLKALSKKSGKEITSLEDFLNPKKEVTEEDKQKAKEQRDAEKIAFGLQKGIISEKKLTKYFADSKNKKDLVFEEYWQTESNEDKTLTKEAAKKEFDERYGLDAEEDSRTYKRGMKEINSLADQIIRNEYPEVFELENKFSEYETGISSTKQKEQTILQKAPQYKKDVEAALDEIKSIKVKRDNDEFEIELDKSILEPYKKQMLEKEYAESKILSGWSKDDIKARYQGAAILENIDSIIFGAIDQAMLRREKGLKGVMPEKPFTPGNNQQGHTDNKKKAEEEIKQRLQGTTAATQAAN